MSTKLKYHFEWVLVGWAMVAVITYFSLTSSPPMPGFSHADKLLHVAGYAGLMFWFAQLYERRSTRHAYAMGFMFMGAGLEVLQQIGGIRQFDPFDMLANITGVVTVWLLWQFRPIRFLHWLERTLPGRS